MTNTEDDWLPLGTSDGHPIERQKKSQPLYQKPLNPLEIQRAKIIAELEDLIHKANSSRKLIRVKIDPSLVFTPPQFHDQIAQGRCLWGSENFELVEPSEIRDIIDEQIAYLQSKKRRLGLDNLNLERDE